MWGSLVAAEVKYGAGIGGGDRGNGSNLTINGGTVIANGGAEGAGIGGGSHGSTARCLYQRRLDECV